jgi:hypothetical protein
VLLFGIPAEEGHALERLELRPDAGGLEIVDHGFADAAERGVAGIFPGVEAVGIAGLGEELSGSGRIVPVPGRLPVELEGDSG